SGVGHCIDCRDRTVRRGHRSRLFEFGGRSTLSDGRDVRTHPYHRGAWRRAQRATKSAGKAFGKMEAAKTVIKTPEPRRKLMNSPIRLLFLGLLIVVATSAEARESVAQGKKMIVGQAGVNPGAGLFSIAVKEGLYQKHGLEVEIIKTNTTAAVQAMLANKMQMATGAGAAAFVTATLEGAPPF